MKPIRRTVAVVASAALLLAMSACAKAPSDGSASSATPSVSGTPADPSLAPVRIGYISQEKELLNISEARKAAEAGVAYVNAELGGVNGHPVELDVCLAGDSPESAVGCAQKFVNDDSILTVITATYSDPTVMGITSKAGLPSITTNTTPQDWEVPSAWAFDAGVSSLVRGAATFLGSSKGAKSTVFLCADDPGILELCKYGEKIFEASDVKVAKIVPVSLDQADYTGTVAAAGIDNVDSIAMVLDQSQCASMAEALATLGTDKPTLSFDACLRPETLAAGDVEGWYEMVASSLATKSDDVAVQEGQRILDTYAKGEPYPYGFAPYGLASTVGASMALASVPYENLTRATADAALGALDEDFGWYPPIQCPGPDPFTGACVRQVTVVQAKGDTLVTADTIDVNVSDFADLLK